MTVFVRGCLESNFDATTGTCTAEVWVPQPPIIPELSIEDAQLIGAKIAVLWAIAFGIRVIRQQIKRS